MVFYAHLLQKALESPTIVVLTDRNDLDDQLFSQFSKCRDFLRQTPVQATSRDHLRNLLNNIKVNGIIFTTMQKFEDSFDVLSDRRNIIVMADEAHRGKYGLEEKVKIVKMKKVKMKQRLLKVQHVSFVTVYLMLLLLVLQAHQFLLKIKVL